MNITPAELEQFCRTISRGSSVQGRAKVIKALSDIGVRVERTPVEKATLRATELIHQGRQAELRAALKLMGVERVSVMGTPQAERFLEFFADPLSFD